MNYQHTYHAGSSADIFKHIVLMLILKDMKKKDKAFFYLDTHAGSALYNLFSSDAQKTQEYQDGIARLWGKIDLGTELNSFLELITQFNPHRLHCYPGSPRIARALLRPQDRMVLIDASPEVYQALRREFTHDHQTQILNQDGYQALKALLPPRERRGVVLIDPAYEIKEEYDIILQNIQEAYRRWSTGVYIIWYPIKNRSQINQFHKKLAATSIPNILVAEFCPLPDDVDQRLNGSGIVIINPPWQLDRTLNNISNQLVTYLGQHAKAYSEIKWLTPRT